jgi:hypothetical protein
MTPSGQTKPIVVTMTGTYTVTPTVDIDTYSHLVTPSWTSRPTLSETTKDFTVTPVVEVVTYTETETTTNG